MKIAVLYKLACMAYSEILRDLLANAINDPNEEWDDLILDMLDKLFSYD